MAGASNYPLRVPTWVLFYQGVNITADISPMVLTVTYTDTLTDSAGSLEIDLEDHQKVWQGPWYPQQGDRVSLLLGYASQELLPCGDFEVDELELTGPPDHLSLRCLAAWITPAMRTRNSIGYENQTLLQIARTIASKYSLNLISASADTGPRFARVTQNSETDLEFLARLAQVHGYNFTVRGTQLIFYAMAALENSPPVVTLSRSDILTFAFLNKTHRTYKAAQVAYQFPANKQLVQQSAVSATIQTPADTRKLTLRCENGQQALLKAESALHAMNKTRITVVLSAPGMIELSAGNLFATTGFGALDGNYLIETARHRLSRDGGFTTEVTARQVDPGPASA